MDLLSQSSERSHGFREPGAVNGPPRQILPSEPVYLSPNHQAYISRVQIHGFFLQSVNHFGPQDFSRSCRPATCSRNTSVLHRFRLLLGFCLLAPELCSTRCWPERCLVMEVAGLVLSIAGLYSACVDIIEGIDTFKDADPDTRQVSARFQAGKMRLKEWGTRVGIVDGKLEELHDSRLEDPNMRENIARILYYLGETFEASERLLLKTRVKFDVKKLSASTTFLGRNGNANDKSKSSLPESSRSGLAWVFRRRKKLTRKVEIFTQLVGLLYELVPPDSESFSGIARENPNSEVGKQGRSTLMYWTDSSHVVLKMDSFKQQVGSLRCNTIFRRGLSRRFGVRLRSHFK